MENIVHVRKESFALKEEAGIDGRWPSFLNDLTAESYTRPEREKQGALVLSLSISRQNNSDTLNPAMCVVFAQPSFYFSKNIHQKPLQKQGEE